MQFLSFNTGMIFFRNTHQNQEGSGKLLRVARNDAYLYIFGCKNLVPDAAGLSYGRAETLAVAMCDKRQPVKAQAFRVAV
jgi:hypothetical protein